MKLSDVKLTQVKQSQPINIVRRMHYALFIGVLLALTACGTPAQIQIAALPPTFSLGTARPFPTATVLVPVVGAAGNAAGVSGITAVVPTETNTPIPPTPTVTLLPPTATATLRPIATATRFVTPVPGDPARGRVWFANGIGVESVPTCASCHNIVDDGTVKTGPLMAGIANRAGKGDRGPDAWTYIHTSIINPNVHLVPNEGAKVYYAGKVSLMYQNYATDLTPAQIDDLTAYLLTVTS